MAADLNDETPQFLDVEYLGQYDGWHFYVAERPEDRALFTSANLPGGIYCGIAIPPIDGKPYPTVENINPPDPSMSVPTGTLQRIGSSKVEAIYKVVEAKLLEARKR
jgi:hypothetical protein